MYKLKKIKNFKYILNWIKFDSSLDELEDLEYYRVKIKGTFDHSKEQYLGPRPLLVSINNTWVLMKLP